MKALKEKIEAERGKDNFPVSGQKLIYAGKILQDDTPIKDYNIDEKNFVVVMVSKVSLPCIFFLWPASLNSVLFCLLFKKQTNKSTVLLCISQLMDLFYYQINCLHCFMVPSTTNRLI